MFRYRYGLMLGFCLAVCSLTLAQQASHTNVKSAGAGFAGNWDMPMPQTEMGSSSIRPMLLNVKGDTLTGMSGSFPIGEGKINGNEATFKVGGPMNVNGKEIYLSIMTVKLYGDQLVILSEESPDRPHPKPGIMSAWTAFRKPGPEILKWRPETFSPLPFNTPFPAKDSAGKIGLTGRFEAPVAWGTKTYTYDFVLEANGDKLSGKAALLGSKESFDIGDGKINGNDVSFTWLEAGQPVARFTGTLYADKHLVLLMQSFDARKLPEVVGTGIHPMTAYRNNHENPWYAWKWSEGSTRQFGQFPDREFDAKVAHPAYTAQHPEVVIDEAHNNFHTADDKYKPFADLMRNDGYEIDRGTQPFTAEGLSGVKVLVIANARGAGANPSGSPPAFTQAECDVVRDWVKDGGSLLLIADHTPFGAAAESLAAGFGVQMGKGFAFVPGGKYFEGNPTFFVFSQANGLLSDHPITRGRGNGEHVQKVLTFTGQALSVPEGATALLKLAPGALESTSQNELQQAMKDLNLAEQPPDSGKWSAGTPGGTTTHAKPSSGAQGLAMPFGKGRVIILGEAAMMTAQLADGDKMGMNTPGNDDRQFALNVMHWLSGLLN